MKTLITEIERFSSHDGPGIRTVVFLKGCPLRCRWCHNPECISFEKEELFYPEKCIGCGKCAEGCYSGARVSCGKEMTPEEVLEEILQDRDYYGTDGGVTVSGGEPLAHPEFTLRLLRLCREKGIGTGIETSLYRYDEDILSLCDVIMTDMKVFDDETHRRYTGIGNEEIKENLIRADGLGIPIIVRTPLTPGVNDSEKNLRATAAFLSRMKNVVKYELLPYHPLGLSKAAALGIEQEKFEVPSKEKTEECRTYAELQRQTGCTSQDQD